MKRLNEIPIGQTVYVVAIEHEAIMKRRLLDLGIVKDSKVTPVLTSPTKGMRAYIIKGCKIALRLEESSSILVRDEEEHDVIF